MDLELHIPLNNFGIYLDYTDVEMCNKNTHGNNNTIINTSGKILDQIQELFSIAVQYTRTKSHFVLQTVRCERNYQL